MIFYEVISRKSSREFVVIYAMRKKLLESLMTRVKKGKEEAN